MVGVLVLVHQHVPEPAAVLLGHLGQGLERLTVTMIRSSKSIAPAASSRRWYSP